MTARARLEQALAAGAIRAAAALLHATYRVETSGAVDQVRALTAGGPPALLAFWHDQVLVLAGWLRRELVRRGARLTVLASASRDGELAARLGTAWGATVVRGSTSRGGTDALRAAYRALARDGSSPVITPDGPRGPRHVAQPGVVVLAQLSGAPILPLACCARSAWRLRSWDRMLVPRPWAQVGVVVGAPRRVARDLDDAGLAAESRALAAELERLELEASGAVRRPRRS